MFALAISFLSLTVGLTVLVLQRKIMVTQAEATAQIDALTAQVEKVAAEIQTLIDAAGSQPNLTPELEASINRLAAAVQTADEKNPDA